MNKKLEERLAQIKADKVVGNGQKAKSLGREVEVIYPVRESKMAELGQAREGKIRAVRDLLRSS